MRLAALCLAASLLLAGNANAGEIVDPAALSVARKKCTNAGLDSTVYPARRHPGQYEVTCVERPIRILLTSTETYAVQQCRNRGWNVRIEVRDNRVRVSCVVL